MSAVISAATTIFSQIFGASGWMSQLITFIVGSDYVLIGLALMLSGAVLSFLRKLISST